MGEMVHEQPMEVLLKGYFGFFSLPLIEPHVQIIIQINMEVMWKH